MITKDSNGQATFHLYGTIGEGWFDDGITAKGLTESLEANGIEKGSELNVMIHSPGGDVFEGIAIAGILDEYITKATVMGLAASMASVIAMSCDECEMVQGSEMMLHNPWSMMAGDSKDFRKAADHLDQLRDNLVGRYSKRLGDAETIKAMLDEETWLSADRAVEIGAADRVKTGTPVKMALMSNLQTKHDSRFLIAASTDPYASKLSAEVKKHLEAIEEIKAEKTEIETELQNAISKQSETAESLAAISTDLDAIKSERDEIEGKLKALESDAARKAALACTQPVSTDLLGKDDDSAGMTAYEQWKSIKNKDERREFYAKNKRAIYSTQPK
jgi:ATP-dependent protease ClpP protease subunit